MQRPSSSADTYRKLAIALGASLLIAALGIHPRAAAADRLLARAALAAAAGQPAAALAALDESMEFDPALASLHLPAAQLAWQAGDAGEMAAHLDDVPEGLRRTAEFACLQARQASIGVETLCGQPEDSPVQEPAPIPAVSELAALAATLRAEVARDPQSVSAWERLALLTELTAPDRVESVILEAYRFFPEGSPLLDGLWRNASQDAPSLSLAERAARSGQMLAAQGDWGMAGAAWSRALEIEPEFPQAEAYLGLAVSKTGGDGLPWLLRASSKAPDDAVVRLLLGQYWLAAGDAASAAREFSYAHRLDPQNPATAAALGAALGQVGRLPDAADAYWQAANVDPQNPTFWLLLAEFSLRYDYQVASLGLEAARNASALNPHDPAATSALGLANALSGDPFTGERLLQRAIALDSANALSWYRYALVLLDQGRLDEARHSLAAAIELDPGGVVAQLADASLANLSGGFQ
jgi:tetratricopeptide (TPR) repeat protein